VYAAAIMGVTGTGLAGAEVASQVVKRVRAARGIPVCVGLGVSDASQAADIAAVADGVIVGAAFVRRLLDADSESAGVSAVAKFATELAKGIRSA
jgi:tryptophan synthase alpha chain